MAIYETIVIFDSLMPPKEIDAAVERFTNIIQTKGGTIRKVDKWGKKRLAYEIEKKQYGYYIAIEFEGSGNIPRELEGEYNYNDKVLRYLTYRYDKRKLKALELEAEVAKKSAAPAKPAQEPAEQKVEEAKPAEEKPAEEASQETSND